MNRHRHDRDVVVMFSENKEGRQDYIYGLLFVGILLFCFLLLWLLAVAACRCVGELRTGYISGYPFLISRPGHKLKKRFRLEYMTTEEELERTPALYKLIVDEEQAGRDRAKKVRRIFITAGLLYTFFGILLVVCGVTEVQQTVSTLQGSAEDINTIALESMNMVENGLRNMDDLAIKLRYMLLLEFQNPDFCPNDPTMTSTVVATDVKRQMDSVAAPLRGLTPFSKFSLDKVQFGATIVQKGAEDFVRATENVDYTDWRALLIFVPYIIVPLIVTGACIFVYLDIELPIFGCVITILWFPLLFVMTMVAWFSAGAMVIAAGANADFCLPNGKGSSPDTTIYNIMRVWGFAETDYAYRIVQYYVSQCTIGDDPLTDLRAYQPSVVRLLSRIDSAVFYSSFTHIALSQDAAYQAISDLDFTLHYPGNIEQLTLYCNRDMVPVQTAVANINSAVKTMSMSLNRTLDLLGCDRIVPIYTKTIYDGVCRNSLKALVWMFSCCLIIGVMGMIMVTFRAAYKHTIYRPVDVLPGEDDSEFGDLPDVDFIETDTGHNTPVSYELSEDISHVVEKVMAKKEKKKPKSKKSMNTEETSLLSEDKRID
jgi:hypothetical protein